MKTIKFIPLSILTFFLFLISCQQESLETTFEENAFEVIQVTKHKGKPFGNDINNFYNRQNNFPGGGFWSI